MVGSSIVKSLVKSAESSISPVRVVAVVVVVEGLFLLSEECECFAMFFNPSMG